MLGKNFDEKLAVLIATWLYTGFIPSLHKKSMAGTWGSLFAIPFCLFAIWICQIPILSDGSPDYYGITVRYLGALIYIYFLGQATIRSAEKIIGPRVDWKGKTKRHDQNQIVIDEVWGMLITYYSIFLGFINVPLISWQMALLLILGFAYFRLFDIVKVWPTKLFDQIESPFGVMMDDGIAGIYAGVLLYFTARMIF